MKAQGRNVARIDVCFRLANAQARKADSGRK